MALVNEIPKKVIHIQPFFKFLSESELFQNMA